MTTFKGLRVRVIHCAPLNITSSIHRVIFQIISLSTAPIRSRTRLVEYQVWIERTVLKRQLKDSLYPDQAIKTYAQNFFYKRYRDSNQTLPREQGALFLSKSDIYLGNPATFAARIHFRPNLVKTTIQLEEENHFWLKTYAKKRKLSLGEIIRRITAQFHADQIFGQNQ